MYVVQFIIEERTTKQLEPTMLGGIYTGQIEEKIMRCNSNILVCTIDLEEALTMSLEIKFGKC